MVEAPRFTMAIHPLRLRINSSTSLTIVFILRVDFLNQSGFPITSVREIRILRTVAHDNIVELLEVVTDSLGRVKDGKVLRTTCGAISSFRYRYNPVSIPRDSLEAVDFTA